MAIGVFGLQVAYKLKRTEVMSSNQTHGWYGGGNTASVPLATVVSTVDRIDFSNDSSSSSVKGSLSSTRHSIAAVGNSNYGWYAGGTNPSLTPAAVSTVDRIDFSNDSGTASVRGLLSTGLTGFVATGNSNYGWQKD